MTSEIERIEISHEIDSKTNTITLKNFPVLEEHINNFLKANNTWDIELKDQAEYKLCREERTAINAKLKRIKEFRLTINYIYMNDFNEKCKALESQLNESSVAHTKRLNAYKSKEKPVKYILTIECKDEAQRADLVRYATSLGANAIIE